MRSLRITLVRKSQVFTEVRDALLHLGYEWLYGDLSSLRITAMKKERKTERLLHIDLHVLGADILLEWEVRTVGLELKKHRKNALEEALFERRLREQLRDKNGQAGAVA